MKELATKWREELTKLSEISRTQPQAAYAAFTYTDTNFLNLCEQLIPSATSSPQ